MESIFRLYEQALAASVACRSREYRTRQGIGVYPQRHILRPSSSSSTRSEQHSQRHATSDGAPESIHDVESLL